MAPSKANREKTAKACKAMKPFGISAERVKSTLKRLLEAYENNWMYIEEDNYKVLIEAIFEPEEHKRIDIVKHEFKLVDEPEDEEEETEPLQKKARLRIQTLAGTSVPCSSKYYASEVQQTVETDVGPMGILEDHQFDKKPKPEFKIPLLVSQAAHLCDPSTSLVKGEKLLALEYNNMDSKTNKNDNDNVPSSPCSSEIDIASSSNGEVKLTFSICKPPPGFRVPSLDAVMKQVEDVYREKIQTKFSLSELLKDICQCFMEQGNSSDVGDKQDPHPTSDNFKENEKQGDPTDDSTQIPRFVVSSEFDHCFSGQLWKQMMVGIDELSGFSSLTIFPNEQPSVDFCIKHYWVADITRGLEKQEISLINEFSDEKLPAFTYIQTNVNYKTANVKFMLARISDENCCPNCFGDCLSPEVPCACAAETGGEFAYTIEGSVDEKFLKNCIYISLKPTKLDYFYCDNCPLERMKKTAQFQSGSCKGHLVRKFIKECWYKCGCGFNCGNRVVQRGIQAKLQVFMTPEGKGWGLRTLEGLPKGTFVCEYVGEIVTNSELFERNEENKNEKHTYPVLLDADWSSEGFLKDEEALCLDATSFGNVARFINHRCEDANMVEIPVEVESPDHHYYHHAFFTTREVKAEEELTWDYGIDFDDDSHPVKAFQCKCGSKSCRAVKHKKRSRHGQ